MISGARSRSTIRRAVSSSARSALPASERGSYFIFFFFFFFTFDGRILFLSQDSHSLSQSQLRGEDVTRAEAVAAARRRLDRRDHAGLRSATTTTRRSGDTPTGPQRRRAHADRPAAIKAGGFAVTVAGRRYGKGSSREHSPAAERLAGIRLVIAESFERIYRQNCRNIGLFTSTDFGLIDRIRRGESIPLSEFTRGRRRDHRRAHSPRRPVQADLSAAGGWRRPGGHPRTASHDVWREDHRSRRRWQSDAVRPGDGVFVQTDWRFAHEYVTPMAEHLARNAKSAAT